MSWAGIVSGAHPWMHPRASSFRFDRSPAVSERPSLPSSSEGKTKPRRASEPPSSRGRPKLRENRGLGSADGCNDSSLWDSFESPDLTEEFRSEVALRSGSGRVSRESQIDQDSDGQQAQRRERLQWASDDERSADRHIHQQIDRRNPRIAPVSVGTNPVRLASSQRKERDRVCRRREDDSEHREIQCIREGFEKEDERNRNGSLERYRDARRPKSSV